MTDRAGGARAIAELQAENDKLQRQLAEIQAAEERKEAKEIADQIEFGDQIDAEAAAKLEADEVCTVNVVMYSANLVIYITIRNDHFLSTLSSVAALSAGRLLLLYYVNVCTYTIYLTNRCYCQRCCLSMKVR